VRLFPLRDFVNQDYWRIIHHTAAVRMCVNRVEQFCADLSAFRACVIVANESALSTIYACLQDSRRIIMASEDVRDLDECILMWRGKSQRSEGVDSKGFG